MCFWVFMLVMDLLVPLTMIFLGFRYEKNVPKEINSTSGYRTAMSMKNHETWEFAHKYVGKLWKVCGWLLLLVSVVAMFFALGKNIIVVSIIGGIVCAIQIAVMIFTMIPTELALKKTFDRNGNRR